MDVFKDLYQIREINKEEKKILHKLEKQFKVSGIHLPKIDYRKDGIKEEIYKTIEILILQIMILSVVMDNTITNRDKGIKTIKVRFLSDSSNITEKLCSMMENSNSNEKWYIHCKERYAVVINAHYKIINDISVILGAMQLNIH